MRIAKTLAVLAAMLLVGAVAIGTLGPGDITLGEAITALNKMQPAAIEAYVRTHLSAWLWDHPIKALLGRPLWLIPTAFSLICAGGAASAASSVSSLNSRRRRS